MLIRLIGIALCLCSIVAAGDQATHDEVFYEDDERGWFWYEDPPVEAPPEKEAERASPPAAPRKQKDSTKMEGKHAPLSVAWIRDALPKLRDTAIDNPSRDNVLNFLYAQRIMMDKAQVFSTETQRAVQSDPLLDENLRLPFASAAKVATLARASDAKKDILRGLNEEFGLWFFFDETCSFCKEQVAPINKLAKTFDFTIQVIHKQGGAIQGLDPRIRIRKSKGHFEELGINFTPAVLLVKPPNDLFIVSQGFTSYEALTDRILAAANENGLITEQQYLAVHPMEKGILRADMVTDEQVNWEDASEWRPFIRKEIARNYGIELPGENDE